MKKSFCICFLVLLVSMTLSACGESGQNEPRTVVDSFATAYFNWRFKEAENVLQIIQDNGYVLRLRR